MKTLFFILFPLSLSAQTRFYITTGQQAIATGPVVTIHSIWTNVPNAASQQATMTSLIQYEGGVSVVNYLVSGINTSGTYTLFRRCLTPPLATQILNCTLSGQIAHRVFNAGHTGIIMLRLINRDGSVAQEIDSMKTTALSSGANYVNHTYTETFTNFHITAGQRLLFEIGDEYQNTLTGANAGIFRGNAPVNSDLPVDNTTVGSTSLNPWFSFSQTIKFMPLGMNF